MEIQEDGEMIHLVVGDDGGGLNLDAIRKKAVDMEIVDPSEALTDQHIVDLIFSSGISTAESVTDISGRGVGMDVVKRNIEGSGGKISVQTEDGRGSSFTVSLPKSVSTQIIDGFLVVARGESYLLQMSEVVESFSPSEVDINTIGGVGENIVRRGEVYSIVRLNNVLEKKDDQSEIDHGVFVMINVKGEKTVLWVDDIEGT